MKKFAVLSLNPGIDRVLYLGGALKAGGMNRLSGSVTSQGSKGANVAIMLRRLGCEVTYYSFTGGAYGDLSRTFTDREGVPSRYVETECGVRVNTKLIDGNGVCTELNERGGPFSTEDVKKLLTLVEKSDADVVCLCGSIPQGVENFVYKLLIQSANAKHRISVLDCDGEAFRAAMEANPSLIKPNQYELDSYGLSTYSFGNFSTDGEKLRREVTDACGTIVENFGTEVLCTLGEGGAIAALRTEDSIRYYDCPPVRVALRGFSGAGDCFLAGYLAAKYSFGMTNPEALAFATACGAAKVSLEGTLLPDADRIDDFYARVSAGSMPFEIRRIRTEESDNIH